jgi:hypothetical protein
MQSVIKAKALLRAQGYNNVHYGEHGVAIRLTGVDSTELERENRSSAAKMAVMDACTEYGICQSPIQVLVAPSKQGTRLMPCPIQVLSTPLPCTEWCRRECLGIKNFTRIFMAVRNTASDEYTIECDIQAVSTMINAMYMKACDLPWRERPRMLARVPEFVASLMYSQGISQLDVDMLNDFFTDPSLVVSADDLDDVDLDVSAYLGRDPQSLLEFYEAVYMLVSDDKSCVHAATRRLCDIAFV